MRAEAAGRAGFGAAASALALALGLGAAGALAAAAPATYTLDDPRPGGPPAPGPAAPSREVGLALGALPRVLLAAPDARRIAAEDAGRARASADKVLRYGVGRGVALSEDDGLWTELGDGGWLWTVRVGSTGALAIRLHFTALRLPAGARLVAASSEGEEETFEVRGDRADAWTPSLAGEAVRVEYLSPPGAARELPFRVDRLQHVYRDPVRALAAGAGLTGEAAGACHNDVSCHPEWRREARAVGGIGIVASDSLFCTGQLLNDEAQDYTPYFLTAHHCVSSARTAASAEVYWFYQTAACDGLPPSLTSVPRSSGAVLLATGAASDYSLLRIEGKLPHGIAWAGWTSKPVADGTPAAVIHHPSGDFKRISFGDTSPELECGGAQHLRVEWTDGPTENGSSGAGAFRADTHQLFGQLHCGPSECGEVTYDQFGSFASTYPHLATLLAKGADDAAEPNDSCAAARAVAPGTYAGRVVTYRSPDWYRLRVPAGRTLRVTLRFAHQDGALAGQLVAVCGGPPNARTGNGRDVKVLQYTNAGAATTYRWKVELPDDFRNDYTMTVALR